MKSANALIIIVVSAIISFATAKYATKPQEQTHKVEDESAYDRVMRTGVLRCAYYLYPDIFEKDLKTGAYSGMYYEITEEIGKQLSLKIDWAEEVGFSNMFDGLKSRRYDAICVPVSPSPGRARVADFTNSLIFAPEFAYARADDERFDNDYRKINDSSVRIAFLEGEMAQTVRNEDFPKSQAVSLPNMADISQVMLQITTGKADIAITEPSTAQIFIEKNPGKIKRVAGDPIRMQEAGLVIGVGEHNLKSMLSVAIDSLNRTGFTERVVNKFTSVPDQIFYVAKPWGASSVPMKKKPAQ